MQSLLRKESETWDLIRRIYFERLNVEEMVREPFSERIKDRYFINETPYIEAILSSDPALREVIVSSVSLFSRKSKLVMKFIVKFLDAHCFVLAGVKFR